MTSSGPRPLALRNGLLVAAIATAVAAVPAADAAVTLRIRNYSGQQVWVMWTGTASLAGTSVTAGGTTTIANSDYQSNAAGYALNGATFKEVTPHEYEISGFSQNGGRMWFTFGPNAWTFQNAGYTPAMATFNDPNFTTRYDKIEASITGSTNDNLDMTAVDGFSIPFTVEGYQSANRSATTQTLTSALGKTIYQALGAVAANRKAAAPVTPAGATPALAQITGNSPYLVINANSQGATSPPGYTGYQHSPIGSSGSFVRVIGNDNTVAPYGGDPVAAANGGVPANYGWTNYENYVKRMDGRAATSYAGTTTIAGSFVGVKPFASSLTAPATYSLAASFSPTEQRTVTYTVPGSGPGTGPYTITFTGWVTISGTTTIASGTFAGTYDVTLKIPYGGLTQYYSIQSGFGYPGSFMLDPSGIVGANANYLYKFWQKGTTEPTTWSQTDPYNGGPQNNILTQIEGDLFAGMNIGATGSTKALSQAVTINGNTYPAGTHAGTFNSQDWFSLGSTLRAQNGGTGSVYDYYFGFLQSDTDLYNQYAAALYPLTDAYAFAYSDRVNGGRVSVAWDATQSNAIDTVVITILPDVGQVAATAATEAVEFHNASLDHYFMTWTPDEIAKLDAGTQIKGWARTGRSIRTYAFAQTATVPMCRFYIPPQFGNSHFFGRDPGECARTAANNPSFVLESATFMYMYPADHGVCPPNATPVYRVYNNRPDANHRYVNDLATRNQMLAQGWIAEGDGPDRVATCAPR